MRRTMSLSVLRRLAQAGLIARMTKNRYVLLREPQGITLLELVRLFHNDLCIGEAYDHYHTFGRENYPSKHYRALMGLEKHMYEKWCGELAATTLARLKNAEAGAKRIREFTEDALPAQCG